MNEFPSAKIIFNRETGSFEDWLDLHNQHIGASDAGGIMSLSSWDTPLSIYVHKKGLVPPKEENSHMRWGKIFEDVIRREFPQDFREQEKKELGVLECPYMYESLDHPFLVCDPDGLVEIDGALGLLEIKRTTGRQARYWKDDQVPDQYYAQVQHSLYILDLPFALVVCLMDSKLFWRYVPRKEIFIKEMVKVEKRFWKDFYLADEMPGPSGQDTDSDLLLELYPTAQDVTVDLYSMQRDLIRRDEIKTQLEALEAEKKQTEQRVMALMGESRRAIAGDKKITWSRFDVSRFDTAAFKRDHPHTAGKYMRSSKGQRLYITCNTN